MCSMQNNTVSLETGLFRSVSDPHTLTWITELTFVGFKTNLTFWEQCTYKEREKIKITVFLNFVHSYRRYV